MNIAIVQIRKSFVYHEKRPMSGFSALGLDGSLLGEGVEAVLCSIGC